MKTVTATTLCALALLFTACGGDDTNPTQPAERQEQTTPKTDEAPSTTPSATFETRNGKGMLVTGTTADARAVCDIMRKRQSTVADGSSKFPIGTDGKDYICDLKKKTD